MKYKFGARTSAGRLCFWIAVLGFVAIYLNYWFAMITGLSGSAVIAVLSMAFVLIGGIGSIIVMFKERDYCVSLFISSFIGLIEVLSILGEFLFQH